MITVILAAGLSTRLRPLTNALPKPMLPVDGRPMLEHIIEHLVSFNQRNIIITTHYMSERIVEHFGDGSRFGASIRYAHEKILMNTAGSLKLMEVILDGRFMVIGGNDFLPGLDIYDFVKFHDLSKGIGTIAFKEVKDPTLFGQGILDVNGRLVSFKEKMNPPISSVIHTTYQIYEPKVLSFIPPDVPASIPEHLIPALLVGNMKIMGYVTTSPFVCISTKDHYLKAQGVIS